MLQEMHPPGPPVAPAQGRFDYVAYDTVAAAKQISAKVQFQKLEAWGNANLKGRWLEKFLDHLEYAYMATGKGIRDEQVSERGAKLQEGRSNE